MKILLGQGGPWIRTRSGLTLLELLVVIAIILVLVALVTPLLGRSKERVQTVVCLNNLRQWGLATQLYVTDHSDSLPMDGVPNPGENPPRSGWYITLPQQLGIPPYHAMPWRTNPAAPLDNSIWICPSNKRKSNGLNLFHYCLNSRLNGTGADQRSIRYTSVSQPGAAVWMFDSKNLPAVGYWGFVHTNLHAQGANFLFLDGHVERLHRTNYWDDATGKGRTNAPNLVWEL